MNDESRSQEAEGTVQAAGRKGPSFEALMAEIERITLALERGDLPLDEALEAFERASALARDAQGLLAAANARLTKLVAGPDRRPEEVDLALPAVTASGPGRA